MMTAWTPDPSRAIVGPGKPFSQGPIITSFRRRRDRDAKGVETREGGNIVGVYSHHSTMTIVIPLTIAK